MEQVTIRGLPQKICRIGLGTWAIGGWMWGGTNEAEAIAAIHHAFDQGINLIDTAPVYGFGLSEEILGKALKSYSGKKDRLVIATKVGLDWREGRVFRDSRKERIFQEIDDSLKRLHVDKIDLYQVHWPDFDAPFEETASALFHLLEIGKIGAIGVCNYTPDMMDAFQTHAPLHALQLPFNMFESAIESYELPYCKNNQITLLAYGSLCRGLLSGSMTKKRTFKGDDLRQLDPKFKEPCFSRYLACIKKLEEWSAGKYHRSVLELALRWVLDKGVDITLWGVRRPQQLSLLAKVWNWKLSPQDFQEIDELIQENVTEKVDADFMAPKGRKAVLQSG